MHLLVPMDESEPARAALEHALETFPDATITVLHVVDPSIAMYGGDTAYNVERTLEIEEERAETLFERARELAGEHDVTVTTETIGGPAARSIVEFADEHDVDGIIIGSHGRSGVSRVLLGSVAERVVRRATPPVTVVS